MAGFAETCVDLYLQFSGATRDSLIKVSTPNIDDHLLEPELFETRGELSTVAIRIVLKILFLARRARCDIMWATSSLAREVTRWSAACDKRLHRLICYIHTTKDWMLQAFVGNKPAECQLVLWADADFAGSIRDSKSTTGAYLMLVGSKTFVPITWISKKQTAVSHSSTEAELISLDAGMRTEALPILSFWDTICQVFHPDKLPTSTQ